MPIPARSGGRAVSSDEWIEVLSPNDGAPVARARAWGAVHVAEAVAAAAATLARADFPQRRRDRRPAARNSAELRYVMVSA